MCDAGQEGIIAKKADAPYSGRRTMNWLKIKCTLRQEFVIVGWTTSKAKGRPFASLVLAQNSADGWRYAGRVGTGIGADVLEDLGKERKSVVGGKSVTGSVGLGVRRRHKKR